MDELPFQPPSYSKPQGDLFPLIIVWKCCANLGQYRIHYPSNLDPPNSDPLRRKAINRYSLSAHFRTANKPLTPPVIQSTRLFLVLLRHQPSILFPSTTFAVANGTVNHLDFHSGQCQLCFTKYLRKKPLVSLRPDATDHLLPFCAITAKVRPSDASLDPSVISAG